MSRTLNNRTLDGEVDESSYRHKFLVAHPKHLTLDQAMYEYVSDMANKRHCISGELAAEKIQALVTTANEQLHEQN